MSIRNAFYRSEGSDRMRIEAIDPLVLDDPVFLGLVAVLLLFFFFGYLLMRRTVLGLKEGYREGRRDD